VRLRSKSVKSVVKKQKKRRTKMLKKLVMGLVTAGLISSLSGIAFCERIKVTFFIAPSPSTPLETFKKMEIAFENAYTSIDLVYEITSAPKFQDMLTMRGAMGDLPDIWQGGYDQNFDKYLKAGLLMPLDNFLETEGIDVSRHPWFAKGERAGKIYAFAQQVGCRGFINYNKDMFDEAGISYLTDDLTWEEFREIAKKLTVRDEDGNVTRYGVLNKYPMYDFAYAFGGRVVDSERKPTKALFGHKEYMAGMKEYLDMVDEGVMMSRRTFDALGGSKPKIFGEGKVAIVVTGMGYGGGFRDSPFEWDVVPLPLKENGGYQGGPGCLLMSSTCKHPNEAIKFLNWYTFSIEAMELRQANFATNCTIPMSPDLQEAFAKIAKGRKPDNWKCVYQARESIVETLLFEGLAEFHPIWWGTVMDIVYGRQPLESLIEAEKEGQKLIDQLPWNQ